MVRINQGPIGQGQPQSSAKASSALTATTSLRSRLAADSDEDLEIHVNQEKKAKRLHRHWDRMVEKLVFMITTAIRSAVEKHWELRGLTRDAPPQEAQVTQPLPQAKGKARRRDDLTGIGAPIPPTAKIYPISRATCGHVHPETLVQSLQAAGGAHLVNGVKVPFYTWVCTRCGARWERIAAGQDRSRHPQDREPVQIATVDQPLPSSSSNSKALVPSAGSRPDVPVKSEGRMRPGAGAKPTSQVAQVPLPPPLLTPWDALPDVMMIHSDLDEEDAP